MPIASASRAAARGPNLASSPLSIAIGAAAEAVIADCFGLSGRSQQTQPSERPAVYGDWRRRRSDSSPMPYFVRPRWPSLLSTDPFHRFIQVPAPISSPCSPHPRPAPSPVFLSGLQSRPFPFCGVFVAGGDRPPGVTDSRNVSRLETQMGNSGGGAAPLTPSASPPPGQVSLH